VFLSAVYCTHIVHLVCLMADTYCVFSMLRWLLQRALHGWHSSDRCFVTVVSLCATNWQAAVVNSG
jgi:hypothetical protein